MRTVKVELTPKFLVYAFLSLVVLLTAWELRSVLISVVSMLFIAFIISAGLRPLVDSLQSWRIFWPVKKLADYAGLQSYGSKVLNRLGQWKLGRPLAIGIIYLALIFILSFLILLLANEFVNQVGNLVGALPGIFQRLINFLQNTFPVIVEVLPVDQFQRELGSFVTEFANSSQFRDLLNGENILTLFNQTLGLFSSAAELLVGLVTVLIISVYMLQRRKPVYEGLLDLIPDDQAKTLRNALHKIEASLGSWLVGQLTLMLIIGIVTYVLILIPGMFDPNYQLGNFAFPIALLAGLLEAIPNVGPAITLVVASLLALGTSGLPIVLYIVISFVILQNLEGVFIVPMIMKRAIGIDPILSILGIIAGFQIGGVIGSILAIPVIGIGQIIFIGLAQEYKKVQNRKPRTLL